MLFIFYRVYVHTILKREICFAVCMLKLFTVWLALIFEMPTVLWIHTDVHHHLITFLQLPPKKKVSTRNKHDNNWITLGIKISCRHYRELHLLCINNDYQKLKQHYQVYCRLLASVMKEAKRNCYDNTIRNLSNKCKATWHIIRKLTNNQHSHTDIQKLKMTQYDIGNLTS
jgi:hypothetical protein